MEFPVWLRWWCACKRDESGLKLTALQSSVSTCLYSVYIKERHHIFQNRIQIFDGFDRCGPNRQQIRAKHLYLTHVESWYLDISGPYRLTKLIPPFANIKHQDLDGVHHCCRSKYILMISPLPQRTPWYPDSTHSLFQFLLHSWYAPRPVSQLVAPPSLVRHSLARCLQTASGWGALVALEVRKPVVRNSKEKTSWAG